MGRVRRLSERATAISDAQPINNLRLRERFRALAQCELEEQEAVIRLIDALVVKHRVESAMQLLGKARGHGKGTA